MIPTKNFYELFDDRYKIFALEGSTWSGKTYSALQYPIALYSSPNFINSKIKEIYHIFGETMPFLKDTAISDFHDIMVNEGLWDDNCWNKTDHEYRLNGHLIKFIALDKPGKAHSVRRHRAHYIELQNAKWEIVKHIIIRTKKQFIGCFNPTHDFFYYTEIQNNPIFGHLVKHIHSTMMDNIKNINESTLQMILGNAANDPYFYDVYVLGKKGNKQGLIYTRWEMIDEMPSDFEWLKIGLDFGFTNHETACVKVGFVNGEVYLDELFYATGMHSDKNPNNEKNIREELDKTDAKKYPIIYDSAEEKAGRLLKQYGYNMTPAKKPAGSVDFGLSICKQYKINVTKRSLNIIKELRNYKWKVDKDGNSLNEPVKTMDHAMDAFRYVMYMTFSKIKSHLSLR